MSLETPPNRIPEEELVQRLKKHDEDVLEPLFQYYGASLYGSIYRVVQSDEVAASLLKKSFQEIWARAREYDRSKGRLYTWLLTISRTVALGYLRHEEASTGRQAYSLVRASELMDPVLNSEKASSKTRTMFMKLRPEQKELLDLIYFFDYNQGDAAKRVKIPLGTVKNRMRSVVKDLRKVLNL